MDNVIVVAVLLAVLALVVSAVSAIVSAAHTPDARWRAVGRRKGTTIALVVLTGGFGGIEYWWRIRPELRDAATSPEPRVPTAAELRAIEAQRAQR